MNLWIFNHYAIGPNQVGVTRHFDLAKNLVKRGHNVTIFASSFNHWTKTETVDYEKNQFYKIEIYSGVKFVLFRTTQYENNGFKRILSMFSYLTRNFQFNYKILNEKPDFILGSMLHHLNAVVAFMKSRKYKTPYIFEERDLWPQTLIDLGKLSKNHLVVKMLDWFESFMYKKADKIIVLFEHATLYVQSKNISPEKILYLPNGTDLSRFNNTNTYQDMVKIRKENQHKKIIGYCGSLSLANNMDKIIELASLMKNNKEYIFVFVGDGTHKSKMVEKVESDNLLNCYFLPSVKKEIVPAILKECDFGIASLKDSPVYKWGFSLNKLYDYMGASLPIILDTHINKNIVTENNLGISSNNLEDIKLQLETIKPNELKQMKENNSFYVKNNHDWSNLALKFENSILKKR